MLFEAEGTTFSAYVLEQRLLEALRRLLDPRLDTQAISQIAYAAGFVDLSHFNRSFRMRFGDTPSGEIDVTTKSTVTLSSPSPDGCAAPRGSASSQATSAKADLCMT